MYSIVFPINSVVRLAQSVLHIFIAYLVSAAATIPEDNFELCIQFTAYCLHSLYYSASTRERLNYVVISMSEEGCRHIFTFTNLNL